MSRSLSCTACVQGHRSPPGTHRHVRQRLTRQRLRRDFDEGPRLDRGSLSFVEGSAFARRHTQSDARTATVPSRQFSATHAATSGGWNRGPPPARKDQPATSAPTAKPTTTVARPTNPMAGQRSPRPARLLPVLSLPTTQTSYALHVEGEDTDSLYARLW